MKPSSILALLISFIELTACCPGPFCEGGPGMCTRLEGRYTLTTDDHEGDCGDVPESTSLVVSDLHPGYSLEASWLRGCVLRANPPDSCQYAARCEAIVKGTALPLVIRVTRNSSGFYGPAEIGGSPRVCKLDVDTSGP